MTLPMKGSARVMLASGAEKAHFLFLFGRLTFLPIGGDTNLEDRNLLKLRSLDPSCPFFLSDNSIWGTTSPNAPNAMIARLK